MTKMVNTMEITSSGTKKTVIINGEDVSSRIANVFVKLDPTGLPEVHLICTPMNLRVTTDGASIIVHEDAAPSNDAPLTYDELVKLPMYSDVWVQSAYRRDFVYAATYVGHGKNIDFYHVDFPIEEYGKTYVCWRKRPTADQIEGVKWNG